MTVKQKLAALLYRSFGRLKIDYAPACPEAEADKQLLPLIRRAVAATLAYEGITQPAYVSVQICTPEHIRELNATYRDKDAETDVLSFPLWERDERPEKGLLELGDIVISYRRAAEQAAELGHSLHREIAFLAIHSTLHLLGYDHERSPEEDEDMCRRQKNIVSYVYQK